MSLSAQEKLRRFYGQFEGEDRVLIVISADPDSIASAMAVKRLLWRKVAGVTISNINVVKRPDNVAMIDLLGVKLEPFDKIDLSTKTRFVMVDSQPSHHELFQAIRPDIIIDHHPHTGTEAPVTDIRPGYGATASIMTEYLRAAGIKPSAKLASGLCYAIKTDTNNFERQSQLEDVRAFQFLFKHANIHLVRKIEHSEFKLEFLDYFKRALEHMYVSKGRVFVHLGSVVNPDVCVLVADFYMKVALVHTSIVSGFYENKLIVVFRNDGLRKDAGKTAQKAFGAVGSAGGHKTMARAEILISNLALSVDYTNETQLQKWIRRRVFGN